MRSLLAALCLVVSIAGCSSNSADAAGDGFRFVQAQPKGEVIPVGSRQKAPVIDGTLLNGGSYDVSTLTGKVVVLNFWAEWCAPCRVESPELQSVYAAYRAKGVQLVGVAVKGTKSNATAFVQDAKLTYPNIFDPRSEIALSLRNYPASAIPSTLVIDASGKVAAVYTGEVKKSDLVKTITALLAET